MWVALLGGLLARGRLFSANLRGLQSAGDEQKPECGSCTSRNVGCVYPRPTFVFEGQGGKSRTFESDVASVASDSPDGYPRIRGSPGARSGRVEHLVDFTVQQPGLGAPEQSPLLSSYAPASHSSPISYAAPSTEAPVGGRLDTQTINSSARSSSRAEAGLLSSFIQDIVPWIVSTCPGSTFANSVIGLAECQPAVRSAMIALVRARNKVICDADGTKVLEEHEGDYLGTVERELGHVDDILAVNVAKSLLSVARLFGSRPTYWGKLGGNYLPAEEGSAEPLRYLLQMQGKIGKSIGVALWALFDWCGHRVTSKIPCRARILHTDGRTTVNVTRILPRTERLCS